LTLLITIAAAFMSSGSGEELIHWMIRRIALHWMITTTTG
jgi:deoxyhypusine synthase